MNGFSICLVAFSKIRKCNKTEKNVENAANVLFMDIFVVLKTYISMDIKYIKLNYKVKFRELGRIGKEQNKLKKN